MTTLTPTYDELIGYTLKDEDKGTIIDLNIGVPPCMYCKWFKPKAVYTGDPFYDGVKLCWGKEMLPDFSCYERKKIVET